MLIRRNMVDRDDIKAFICFCHKDTAIEKLAEISNKIFRNKKVFVEMKKVSGLGNYEVRKYHAWYKHITLSCATYALLKIAAIHTEADFNSQLLRIEG